MTPIKQTRELGWKYPAALTNVEQICSAAAKEMDGLHLQQKDRFAVEILLRESLNNAVLHGCKQDPLLFFSCSLMIAEREVIIEVSDEGTGFDWRSRPETPPDDADESGRGLAIYAIYAHSIHFNDAGNRIRLTRILNQGENND
jgi:serine/threonine-protein kinase RsbW